MAEKMVEALGREVRYFEYKLRQRKTKRRKVKENRFFLHLLNRKHQQQIKGFHQKSVTLSDLPKNQIKPDDQSNVVPSRNQHGANVDSLNQFAVNGPTDKPSSSTKNFNWETTFENQHQNHKSSIDSSVVCFDSLNTQKNLLQCAKSNDFVGINFTRNNPAAQANKLPSSSRQNYCSSNNSFLKSSDLNDPWSVLPTTDETEKKFHHAQFNPFKMDCIKPVDDKALEKLFGDLSFEQCEISSQKHDKALNQLANQDLNEDTESAIGHLSVEKDNDKLNKLVGYDTLLVDLENLIPKSISSKPRHSMNKQSENLWNKFEPKKHSLPTDRMQHQKFSNASATPPVLSVLYQSSSLASRSELSNSPSGSLMSNTPPDSYPYSPVPTSSSVCDPPRLAFVSSTKPSHLSSEEAAKLFDPFRLLYEESQKHENNRT